MKLHEKAHFPRQIERVIQLSYTGRHTYQRALQVCRVLVSGELHKCLRLLVFVLLDLLLGLCLAHLLRGLFVTPQRSIGTLTFIQK